MKPKLIYLARRNPVLTAAGFVPRWRRHGALGMSLPRWKNVWRYAHNDVVPGGSAAPAYDGVGMVWHHSPEARVAHRQDRSSQDAMERDELETFDALIARSCATYEEEIVASPRRGARIKLIRFRDRDPALSEQEVGRSVGMVRNRRLPPEASDWGLAYPVVDEFWFEDLAAARLVAARTEAMSLVVEETVLYRLDRA